MPPTAFIHEQRSGRRRRPKQRRRQGLGIRSLEGLIAHRDLAFLRNPSAERARKLDEATRRR